MRQAPKLGIDRRLKFSTNFYRFFLFLFSPFSDGLKVLTNYIYPRLDSLIGRIFNNEPYPKKNVSIYLPRQLGKGIKQTVAHRVKLSLGKVNGTNWLVGRRGRDPQRGVEKCFREEASSFQRSTPAWVE